MEKLHVFCTLCQERWIPTCRGMKLNLYFKAHKNQLEKNKDLNMKPESIQLLVEKLRGKIP